MGSPRWARADRLMRWIHLYTSLFLVPWMLVYAVSAFCLNHHEWVTKGFGLETKWTVVEKQEFTPDAAFPQAFEEQAQALLKRLALEGPHRIAGTPDANQLTIYRLCAAGWYRVTWQRPAAQLVVEQQRPCSFYSFVNSLHFQRGYDQKYAVYRIWAIVVDTVTISTVLWVVTGIYLWARRPHQRLLGAVCLVAGIVLFAGLAIGLCY